MKTTKDKLNYYMELPYDILINIEDDDGINYVTAGIPDLDGCSAIGNTIEEAINNLNEHKRAWIEVSLNKGLPIPEPVSKELYSGKFLLRIPIKLHMTISKEAEKHGVSLNQYIRESLEKKQDVTLVLGKLNDIQDSVTATNAKVEQLERKLDYTHARLLSSQFENEQSLPSGNIADVVSFMAKKRVPSEYLMFEA